MSASAKTMAGALPPSSSDTLVMFWLAAAMILCPALTEPVTLTMSVWALSAIALPTTLPLPVTILITPAGNPLSSTTWANSQQFSGVSCEGFSTMVHPAMSDAPAFRAMRKNGKFHGSIPATTPMGRRVRIMVSPLRSLGITSPSICLANEAI